MQSGAGRDEGGRIQVVAVCVRALWWYDQRAPFATFKLIQELINIWECTVLVPLCEFEQYLFDVCYVEHAVFSR